MFAAVPLLLLAVTAMGQAGTVKAWDEGCNYGCAYHHWSYFHHWNGCCCCEQIGCCQEPVENEHYWSGYDQQPGSYQQQQHSSQGISVNVINSPGAYVSQ